MHSENEYMQRKQNTSKKKEGCREDDVVNTQGPHGVQSMDSTQTEDIAYTKHNNLMSKVLERENLKRALEKVEANKGAPGTDGMPVGKLRGYLKEHWETLKVQLEKETYKPEPVRRVSIPKPNGGARELGIPTVLDRFIQQAISQVLTPIFDKTFSRYSYGFRQGKSTKQAVKQAQEYVQEGYRTVVDTDLAKFFDTVNHDILIRKLYERIDDKQLLGLIRKYLKAGVMINGCCVTSEEGTPQGGPLSPLLSNIMLDEVDKELEKRGHKFVRYADDCNIYVRTNRAGERVFASITRFIETRLKLRVNKEKSAVDYASRRKILGFKICGKILALADQTVKRLKDKIRLLTRRNWSVTMETRISRLNEYLKGWLGYFWIAQAKGITEEIDSWMRRRLRMVLLKQWKLCRTKLRELKALGIPEKWGGKIAYSRKKYWRLSNTPQVSKALGLSYWKAQGLISLQEIYCAKWDQKVV